MKIAVDTARGLEYLHCKANPPVIFRDLKPANILLDNDFNARLSDFGLAKLGPVGDKTHVSTRVMGTYGYCAPEYALSGKLTVKSDIFSLGVVLLEILTGRKAIDPSRSRAEQNLVTWVSYLLINCFSSITVLILIVCICMAKHSTPYQLVLNNVCSPILSQNIQIFFTISPNIPFLVPR